MDIEVHPLTDDGEFPNNEQLPLILYRDAVSPDHTDPAQTFEQLFSKNQWTGSWRNGIYGFHHYHSTAHEVLGVYGGSAEIQLGGDQGIRVKIATGDVIVIPAGVAHKNLDSSDEFRVVGAYPKGQTWDMNYGNKGERPRVDKNIKKVSLPAKDPVRGDQGPVWDNWLNQED